MEGDNCGGIFFAEKDIVELDPETPPPIRSAPFSKHEEIWLQAWTSTANAANCNRSETATNYADICLERFKERFEK